MNNQGDRSYEPQEWTSVQLVQFLMNYGVDVSPDMKNHELLQLAKQKLPKHMEALSTLQVSPGATESVIHRAYLLQVKLCHPDTHPELIKTFNRVTQAFKILEKCSNNREIVRETEGPENKMLLLLFGGSAFIDYFGPVMDYWMHPENKPGQKWLDHQALILAGNLAQFLDEQVRLGDCAQDRRIQEGHRLLEAPAGGQLLGLVGYVYMQKAKQYSTRHWGLSGFWNTLTERTHLISQYAIAVRSNVQTATIPSGSQVTTPQKRQCLYSAFHVGCIHIAATLRRACDALLQKLPRGTAQQQQWCETLEIVARDWQQLANSTQPMEQCINNLLQLMQ